jgi:hypothetical protein
LTGPNRITTASLSACAASPMSIDAFVIASPFSVSTFKTSPVSRLMAEGFDTVLPRRTTLTYLSAPSRVSV